MKKQGFYIYCSMIGGAGEAVEYSVEAMEGYKKTYKAQSGEAVTVYFDKRFSRWWATEGSTGLRVCGWDTLKEAKAEVQKRLDVLAKRINAKDTEAIKARFSELVAKAKEEGETA